MVTGEWLHSAPLQPLRVALFEFAVGQGFCFASERLGTVWKIVPFSAAAGTSSRVRRHGPSHVPEAEHGQGCGLVSGVGVDQRDGLCCKFTCWGHQK
jgi:hypothetical protein